MRCRVFIVSFLIHSATSNSAFAPNLRIGKEGIQQRDVRKKTIVGNQLQQISLFTRHNWLISKSHRYSRISLSSIQVDSSENVQDFNSILVDHHGIDVIDGPFQHCQLKSYWGERPLLIRNAFDPSCPDIQIAWPSWDEILSLSCYSNTRKKEKYDDIGHDSGHSARLIQHTAGKLQTFDLELGPFDRKYLNKIMTKSMSQENTNKWTLLLNDVGRYRPECHHWINRTFGTFLPRWRLDDAQISIAGAGGGIGQHVDNYDVFLIQTSGSRRWDINPDNRMSVADEYSSLVRNIPVRILQLSTTDGMEHVQLILNPGDMLYLPPRIVHCGTATDDSDRCMTLSVGFRAPSASDLTARVAEYIQQSVDNASVKRYTDSRLSWSEEDPNTLATSPITIPTISSSIRSEMKSLVLDAITTLMGNELEWDKLVGGIVTESIRYSENAVIRYDDNIDEAFLNYWGDDAEEVLRRIVKRDYHCLKGCVGIAFATSSIVMNETSKVDRLYAHGEMWEVWDNPLALPIFQRIESNQILDTTVITEALREKENGKDSENSLRQVLLSLIDEGVLRPHLMESIVE
jgi:ribosomal protein L16 Arg81 hydroxylase